MPILSDIEILKSAIIYGDLDDAMALIRKRKESLSYVQKRKPSQKVIEYSEFLDSLESLLRGEMTLEGFKSTLEGMHTIEALLDISGDETKLLDSLYYLLEYSLDRYNVSYPSYDGKRCDDK